MYDCSAGFVVISFTTLDLYLPYVILLGKVSEWE
jgi:hypothetical protein